MRAKNIIVVADTETIGLPPHNHCYDFGYVIMDQSGNVLFEKSHLIEEIITDGDKMTGAYYTKRAFTHYLPLVDAGMIDIMPFNQVKQEFLDVCSDFGVNVFSAYNLGFDMRSLAATNDLLDSGKFLNYIPKLLDVWQFACETVLSQKLYAKLAKEKNWVSEAGNMRTNAECAYRYISGQWDAVEAHTALCDARIEGEILARCFQQKKAVPYGKFDAQPWRIVNA
jgi:hypothetical protein